MKLPSNLHLFVMLWTAVTLVRGSAGKVRILDPEPCDSSTEAFAAGLAEYNKALLRQWWGDESNWIKMVRAPEHQHPHVRRGRTPRRRNGFSEIRRTIEEYLAMARHQQRHHATRQG